MVMAWYDKERFEAWKTSKSSKNSKSRASFSRLPKYVFHNNKHFKQPTAKALVLIRNFNIKLARLIMNQKSKEQTSKQAKIQN